MTPRCEIDKRNLMLPLEQAGVDRIILWGIREMKGDKIASSRCCLPDRTDPQTARFLEWDYAHPSK